MTESSTHTQPIEALSLDCLIEMGLSRQPFTTLYDQRFVFHDVNHDMTMKTLVARIEAQEPSIALEGESGTGKSLLLYRLQEMLPDPYVVIHLPMNRLKTLGECERYSADILHKYGLCSGEESLPNQLDCLADRGRLPVLILDNVHAFPEDAAERLVSELMRYGSQYQNTTILWVGNERLRQRLDRLSRIGLSIRDMHQVSLRRLNRQQMQQYLSQRIEAAGAQLDLLFSSEDLVDIWAHSDGIPARINERANQLLDARCQKQQSERRRWLNPNSIRANIIGLSASIVSLILSIVVLYIAL